VILTLAAIGRLKDADPEQALTRDWIGRAEVLGRGLGIRPVRLVEVDSRASGNDREREAGLLLAALPASAEVWMLDEHGEAPGSAGFAQMLGIARDRATPEVALVIGGADGHGSAVRQRASRILAFGRWTWPHRLVRAMAAEQLYRGLSILAGTPYHRV
jgi:23S rRNA (pseudouridine1915-N3)-methyltransferase